jgi:hypothetical protein
MDPQQWSSLFVMVERNVPVGLLAGLIQVPDSYWKATQALLWRQALDVDPDPSDDGDLSDSNSCEATRSI